MVTIRHEQRGSEVEFVSELPAAMALRRACTRFALRRSPVELGNNSIFTGTAQKPAGQKQAFGYGEVDSPHRRHIGLLLSDVAADEVERGDVGRVQEDPRPVSPAALATTQSDSA